MEAQAKFSPFRVYRDEVRIVGSMAILHSFERAIEVMAAGAVDGSALISHEAGLDSYGEALELFRSGACRKILVTPTASGLAARG